MNNCAPYWDCHGFFKASQWRCVLCVVVVITRLPRTFGSRNDDVYCVWCYHTKIATSSMNSRNDDIIFIIKSNKVKYIKIINNQFQYILSYIEII